MSDPAVKSIPAVFGRLNAEQRAHIVTSMRTILDALTPEERDRSRPTHTWINYWAQEIIDAIAKTEAPRVATRRFCTFCGAAFGLAGMCGVCKPPAEAP